MFVVRSGASHLPLAFRRKRAASSRGLGKPETSRSLFPYPRRRRPTAEEEPGGPEFGGISGKVLGGESRESA
jgi:hypothetical protein